MPRDLVDATLISTHRLTPRVKQFLLLAEGHTFEHVPGQHVSVTCEDPEEGRVYRPYSPLTLPGTDKIALAIKRYASGTCSARMHEHTVGATIPLTAPSGNLHLHDLDRDAVFLATGTGLTPMLAMITQYLRDGTGEATLLFGERTEADLMFRDTLDRMAASHPNFSVAYVLSDESWTGPNGYVQDHLTTYVRPLRTPHFYACGVPEMVVDTQAVLREEGVPDEHIFTEGWEEGAVDD